MRSPIVKSATRGLVFCHRWLGIVTCLLCVMWFLSGLTMLYVPFPAWTDEERIKSLPPVATERVRVLPDQALARSGISTFPTTFRLEMFADTPVYRIMSGDRGISLSAFTGEIIDRVSQSAARRLLVLSFPDAQPEFLAKIDYDQWTVTRRFDPHRPLLKFSLGDRADMIVYVSSTTGEIIQNATRSERYWNWFGAIPHWIYFSPLRKDQELWRQCVIWLSGPLVIGAIAGLLLGVIRLRVRKRGPQERITPYRGWMKWHHIGGLVGGVFLATWIASGWLSVNPFSLFAPTQLTEDQRSAFAGWQPGMAYEVTSDTLAAAGAGASAISFLSVAGRPLIVSSGPERTTLLDARTGMPVQLDDATLVEASQRAFPTRALREVQRLTEETIYWYSHHNRRPLPVLKVSFDDPSSTWLFLDPETGEIAGLIDRSARVYRWLFSFLHNYDLPILLRNRPARDLIVWLLSIAGLVVAVSGAVIGYRVLTRRSR